MRSRYPKETRTAQQAYDENRKAIETLMKRLSEQLAEHHTQQAKDARNWGYVGDLGEIRSRLETAVSFLAGDEE